MHRKTFTAALIAAAAALALPAAAQTAFPTKTVRLMVGAGPGGGTDIIARMLAEKFAEGLKGTFVVENRPGASNTIAADMTAKAPADGHTLLVATNTGQAIAPHLLKLAFDPIKDLTPIGLIVTVPNVLVVGAQVPVKNVAELVAAMKAKPGDFKYASSGVGSTQHIAGEAFDAAAGTKSQHIPYKGSSQAHLDIIGGSVQMMFDTTSSAMGQIKGGKFKPLAVTTPTRSPQLPDVPTLAEAGVPDFDVSAFYGLAAPAGVPADVLARVERALEAVVRDAEIVAAMERSGASVDFTGARATAEFMARDGANWKRVVEVARIKLD